MASITFFLVNINIIYLQSQMRKQKRQDTSLTSLQNANKRNRKDV